MSASARGGGDERGGEEPAADVLELEHAIGYTGRSMGTLHCHPRVKDAFVVALGASVVLGSVTDPHAQSLLRVHDEEVTAIALSPSGALLASGQMGSARSPSREAPIVVWQLEPVRRQVRLLCFVRLFAGFVCSPHPPHPHPPWGVGTFCCLLHGA